MVRLSKAGLIKFLAFPKMGNSVLSIWSSDPDLNTLVKNLLYQTIFQKLSLLFLSLAKN